MKRPAKRRRRLYLDADVSERLETFGAQPGAPNSAILADAIEAWLTERGAHELADRFGHLLERISAQPGRIHRDQQITMESLAHFIRYFLTVNAPLPEAEQAARALGRDRLNAFIDQVARNLASGARALSRAEPATSPEEIR
jgi:hypothetical protein